MLNTSHLSSQQGSSIHTLLRIRLPQSSIEDHHTPLSEILRWVTTPTLTTSVTRDSDTSLHSATLNGCAGSVKALLANGASSSDKSEALRLAVGKGSLEIVNLLLANGTDPNSLDRSGSSILHAAAFRGHFDIATALLNKGANPGICNFFGEMALDKAAYDGHNNTAKLLLDRGIKPIQSKHALLVAAGRGNLETVNILLENGANPNTATLRGFTPLGQAVTSSSKDLDIVMTLLDNGARPAKSPDALVEAASRGKLEIVETLLANGAMVDMPDKNGRTALQQARLKGHTDIVNVLETHIPQVNPDSLLFIARTCIRTRLIERQADRKQSLSSLAAELPLPSLVQKYVYGHLTLHSGPPGEVSW